MIIHTRFPLILALAVTAWAADLKEGQQAYEKSCKSCHGADGTPNPAMVKLLKAEMKALGSAEVQAQPDAKLAEAIKSGTGKMKRVTTVTGTQVDSVVAYVRTLKK